MEGKVMSCEKLSVVAGAWEGCGGGGRAGGRGQAAKEGSGPSWEALALVGELMPFPVGRGSHQRVK